MMKILFTVVFAELDDDFELVDWDPSSKVLSAIMIDNCPGGNIEGLGTNCRRNPYSILFRASR